MQPAALDRKKPAAVSDRAPGARAALLRASPSARASAFAHAETCCTRASGEACRSRDPLRKDASVATVQWRCSQG